MGPPGGEWCWGKHHVSRWGYRTQINKRKKDLDENRAKKCKKGQKLCGTWETCRETAKVVYPPKNLAKIAYRQGTYGGKKKGKDGWSTQVGPAGWGSRKSTSGGKPKRVSTAQKEKKNERRKRPGCTAQGKNPTVRKSPDRSILTLGLVHGNHSPARKEGKET